MGRGTCLIGLSCLSLWMVVRLVSAMSSNQDLVFFTDDKSGREPGCDKISVYEIGGAVATAVYRDGPNRSSPARLTAREDLSLIISQNSNDDGLGLIGGQPLGGHLRLLWDLGQETWPRWKSELVTSDILRLSQLGAPLLLPDGVTLLCPVELPGAVRNGPTVPMLMRFNVLEISGGKLGTSHGALRLEGLVVGQFLNGIGTQVHLLTTEPMIRTIDVMTMQETEAPIGLPPFKSNLDSTAQRFPERFMHGVLTSDRRFLLGNLGFSGKIFVADLESRQAWEVPVAGSSFVGGLDISRGPENRDLLAIHLGDTSAIFSFDPPTALTELVRQPVNTDWPNYDPYRTPNGDAILLGGPANSIAWASGGRKLLAAHDVDRYEPFGAGASSTFRVFDVAADGRSLRPVDDLVGCAQSETMPSDILTYNSLFPLPSTPPPLSTVSEPTLPSPEPSASATPTVTAAITPTVTATATASMTPTPFRAYLPLILREPPCKPDPRPVDAVLVLDASSSMEGAKLAAAQSAARAFLAVLDLRTDRMGLVSFNREGAILSPLNADNKALITAIDALQTSPGTRMDRGLAEAQSVLAAGGRPEAAALVVLLTDGRQDEQPDLALEAAARLRAASVRLEAVGYGADADLDFLIALTTDQDRVHRAADEASLVAIYRMLAATDCAREPGWSGR